MEQHDIIATPQEVGSCLSANMPDMSLVRRRRGRPMKEIPNGHCSAAFSSDSSLEKTPSSVIMSNETVNTNTRFTAPINETSNVIMVRCLHYFLPRRKDRPPMSAVSIAKFSNVS
ncbi:hypothetical protein Tco_1115379 [Tanacetum coccineum]